MTARGTSCSPRSDLVAGLVVAAALLVGAGCGGPEAITGAESGDVVMTLLPSGAEIPTGRGRFEPGRRYPEGTRVVRVTPGRNDRLVELSPGTVAAGAPDVSPDGLSVLFAARRAGERHWGIYESDGDESTPRPVFEGPFDCVDPAYLAGEAVVFSCAVTDDAEPIWALFVDSRNGSEPERITFGLTSVLDPMPLRDGRILFAIRRPGIATDVGPTDLFTVNPDGSLLEAFGEAHATNTFRYRPRQAGDGSIVLMGLEPGALAPQLLRLDMTRPEARALVTVTLGDAPAIPAAWPLAAEPTADGMLVVVQDGPASAVLRLRPGHPATPLVGPVDGRMPIEAAPVIATLPPRGRPRIVGVPGDPGQVVGYDAGRSDGVVGPPQGSQEPHAVWFQTARAGRTLSLARQSDDGDATGAVSATGSDADRGIPIAADRSFFFQIPADVPLRITTLDARGDAIATSAWFWVRPGETRACFGCHEGHAAAPVNRPIEAISRPPVALEALLEARLSPAARSASSEGGQ